MRELKYSKTIVVNFRGILYFLLKRVFQEGKNQQPTANSQQPTTYGYEMSANLADLMHLIKACLLAKTDLSSTEE